MREGRRDEVVAADADHLLGDIGFDREVAAPGRDGRIDHVGVAGLDVERLGAGRDADPGPWCGRGRLDPDPGEERSLLVGCEVRAQQPVDPGRPEGDVRERRLGRVRIDHARRDLAACPFGDEAGRAIGTDPREAELLALLEAEARLGAQGVAEGRPPDADRVEDRRLDDDVGGPLPDLGVGAAHHAGDPDRTALVGDQERLGVELADDVVERLEALARESRGGR